ncbi:MAG: folate family ECF transporter S component [Firmicutes bacterium]|nr:folate family ECF transporter S component [Bacillota bacterium]NLL88405.1 folate family ECF transporter S component [Bacillota bacterium]HKM17574.1 folate family ECF transporter S component [Limnochordia bacterium]
MYKHTRMLVYLAVLVALNIVLSRFLSARINIAGVEGIRIGLGGLPIILAGIAFGPWHGGVVGAIADIVGCIVSPMGGYAPHFTLSAYLTAFIPGAITWYVFKGQKRNWQLILAIFLGELVTNVGLVPYFLYILYGVKIQPLFIPRLCSVLIQAPFYAYCTKVILDFNLLRLTNVSGQPKR